MPLADVYVRFASALSLSSIKCIKMGRFPFARLKQSTCLKKIQDASLTRRCLSCALTQGWSSRLSDVESRETKRGSRWLCIEGSRTSASSAEPPPCPGAAQHHGSRGRSVRCQHTGELTVQAVSYAGRGMFIAFVPWISDDLTLVGR